MAGLHFDGTRHFLYLFFRTILNEKSAIRRFRVMYDVTVSRIMYAQLILSTSVASVIAATMIRKYFLMRLYGESFLNLNENIGISLTSMRASITDAIGMK